MEPAISAASGKNFKIGVKKRKEEYSWSLIILPFQHLNPSVAKFKKKKTP